MHKVIQPGRESLAELERLRCSGLRVDAVDENGQTCLFVAAASGEEEVTEWLLSHGADPSAVSPIDGRTPLHAASAHGHVAVVARLLSAGANSTKRDEEGLTPAEVAHAATHLDVVRVFLEHSRHALRDEHLEVARKRRSVRA